ncbi:asparagine synthase [Hesseltinella vesiculosa]|uniref:Asparagine synthase n=1 Tax=Hesseltinella vesiculosa TaxID=101127 RepID=A0A1X2GMR2_9FUNG|nr:asparagine synthase [Hesseltinella vesiculosa]
MCGITAYFYIDPPKDAKSTYPALDLQKSMDAIYSRGPDSNGTYVSPCGRCGLGHVRLSIIDLSGGQQPLSNASNTVHAVVNGELYDHDRLMAELESKGHKFKTRSDSELALHFYEDYDTDFLEKLRGEFACAIWDERKKRFLIARDRFGIKPMYYTIYNGVFMAASEIKALIGLGWKPEWDVNSIVHNGPICDYRTCFKGVYKVPPGHYLLVSASGSIDIKQYWDADYPDKNIEDPRSVEEMIKGVHDRVLEAVRLRLRADVPLGIYLSGGLDSSAIAGVATHLLRQKDPNAKVEAFSISFTESGKYDEGEIAERTAAHVGANFHKLPVTQADMVANFEETVWHIEQPTSNLNTVGKFLLSKFVRDNGYKVVMTGEGSDEHFIGYGAFEKDYLREPDNSTPGGFGRLTDEERRKLYENQSRDESSVMGSSEIKNEYIPKARWTGSTAQDSAGRSFCLPKEYYSETVTNYHGMPDPGSSYLDALNAVTRSKARTKWHPVHGTLYLECRTFLPNYLCNHLGDRIEMAHSIEARTPFLDHPLAEYVNSLPPSVKLCGKDENGKYLNEKWVLKKAMEPYITKEILERTKHPYVAPTANPEEEPIVAILEKLVTKENIARLGFLNWEECARKKESVIKTGNPNDYKNMLQVMSLCVLSDRFNVPPATI